MSPSWTVKQAWAYQMRGWWEPKVSRSAEFVLYLCAATFASTTPTLRTHDRTGSISTPRPLSFNPLASRIKCSWIPNIYTLLRSSGNTFLKQLKKTLRWAAKALWHTRKGPLQGAALLQSATNELSIYRALWGERSNRRCVMFQGRLVKKPKWLSFMVQMMIVNISFHWCEALSKCTSPPSVRTGSVRSAPQISGSESRNILHNMSVQKVFLCHRAKSNQTSWSEGQEACSERLCWSMNETLSWDGAWRRGLGAIWDRWNGCSHWCKVHPLFGLLPDSASNLWLQQQTFLNTEKFP